MATDEVMKNYFARFIGHEMMFMVFSIDFHGKLMRHEIIHTFFMTHKSNSIFIS